MRIDWFFLLWGLFMVLFSGFGVAFPDLVIRLDKAIIPKSLHARMERVMPISPRAVRTWNSIVMLAGVALMATSVFIGD